MPYLIESNEWRLLHGLTLLLDQRKARYCVQPGPLHDHGGANPNAELFEFELRRVFTVKEYSQNLDPMDFEQCQSMLVNLCSLLNRLAWPQNTDNGPQNQTYPHLRALTVLLEKTTGAIDLANGPNQTMFKVPHVAAELNRCLNMVTECNNFLSRLLEPPSQGQVIQPARLQQTKATWKKSRIRNQATFVLGRLFRHLRCETSHEVMLKLIEDPGEDSMMPGLQLLLSPCPELKAWQEVLCGSVHLYVSQPPHIHEADIRAYLIYRGESSVSSVLDICANLREHAGEGKSLMLLIKEYGLFGAWARGTSSVAGQSRQSLDQLILKGAFKPLGLDTLFHGAAPAKYSTKDKRALAVKLGFCLMDFFDVDVTSNRIYFLDSSSPQPEKDVLYLSFGSRLPATPESYHNFEVGHPALLSFAKLLLEIEFGQNINLDISPHNSQNQGAWVKLLTRVDTLAQERSDSYLQAIRACLVVHMNITKALRSRDIKDKSAADSMIRKKLHKKVIRKLERGLTESIPRTIHKRQRSESPPSHGHWEGTQAGGLSKMAIRPVAHKQEELGYKRRCISKTERPPSPVQNDALNLSSPLLSSISIPPQRASGRDDFEVAIICAVPAEYNAVSYLFDEFWDEDGDQYGRAPGDLNNYTTGRMGNYNVVLALLSHMGKANAAGAAASMRSSYSKLRLALLVGVCGAAPYNRDSEILLGDVIISKIVVQHDFGRKYADRFKRKDTIEASLGRPNKDIRNLVCLFETDRGIDRLERRTAHFLQVLQAKVAQTKRRGKYDHPGVDKDKLFKMEHRHKHHASLTCDCYDCHSDSDPVCDEALTSSCAELGCAEENLVARERLRTIKQQSEQDDSGRATAQPTVHVGVVASGDAVIKSAAYRDKIVEEAGVIGFEMEGAGVWDEVPSIVVKGVCDYADCHKTKDWQDFAAAAAASACKAILESYIRADRTMGASIVPQ